MTSQLNFTDSEKSISINSINKFFFSTLGIHPPLEFIEIYEKSNGGIPSKPFFKNKQGVFNRIKCFLPFSVESDVSRNIEETIDLGRKRGFLPTGILPFAIDEGGNYLCFTHEGEIIYYTLDDWDEDLSPKENITKAINPLTNNFSTFIEGLRRTRK